MPRKANFLDGVAAVLFASALKGNVGAARVIHDVIEGERVVIPEEGYGTGQVREAINRIRELYGLEQVSDAAVPVKTLPAPEGADKPPLLCEEGNASTTCADSNETDTQDGCAGDADSGKG